MTCTTLDMCQKVTAELENKKSSNEKDQQIWEIKSMNWRT